MIDDQFSLFIALGIVVLPVHLRASQVAAAVTIELLHGLALNFLIDIVEVGIVDSLDFVRLDPVKVVLLLLKSKIIILSCICVEIVSLIGLLVPAKAMSIFNLLLLFK